MDHLHQRPRRDGRQPRADVQVRPLRAGRARPADRPARPAGCRAARRRLPSWSTSTCRPPCARSPAPRAPRQRGTLAPDERPTTRVTPPARSLAVSENWGFAAFETDRYKLVVDEDAVAAVPALRPVRGSRRGPRSPARLRRRHPSWRSSWRPTSARSSARRRLGPSRALHRRVRLNVRPAASPARAGPPSAPRQRSGCGGPPPRCGARAPGFDRRHRRSGVTHADRSSKIAISLREICGSPAP